MFYYGKIKEPLNIKYMIISKDFHFEAAHHLRNYIGKCQFPHGHSYHGTVWVDGKRNEIGFVIDYGEISEIINYFDHKDLNELPEFQELNPTAENIAYTIMIKLANKLTDTHDIAVKIHETASSSAFKTTNPRLIFLAR